MKIGQQSLLGYLPAQVIKSVLDKTLTPETKYPLGIPVETVSLFADISGFTKLSEKFSKKGRTGPECLAFCLNRYMEELINMIAKNGGDIFKFAGDALLVIWPKSSNSNLIESCRRAMQCAIAIQNKLHNLDMGSGNKLSVKIGIGVGECKIFFVGGKFKRAEYLIVGPAMKQACCSECHITEGGQIVVSEKVFDLIKDYFDFTKTEADLEHPDTNDMDYYRYNNIDKEKTKLQVKAEASLMRTNFNVEQIASCMGILRTFVPAAITIYLDIEKENWCKELRLLTIMFIKLSVDLKDTETAQGQTKIQNVVFKVQQCVYRTRGSLNKFLMDDKGSVLLLCWGLPPFSTPDDQVRAVMSAIDIVNELKSNFGVSALIGITTGCVFSGVCGGSGARREYSLLGEIVNLSARFMQTAIMTYEVQKSLPENKAQLDKLSIFLCENTKKLIQNKIFCEYRVRKQLKGFSEPFDHYSPLTEANDADKLTNESIFTLIKTHRNNRHSEKEINVESESKSIKLIGFAKEKTIFNLKYKLSQTQKGQLLLISGIIGSGKSFFVRSQLALILKEINSEHLSRILFISNQTPITHTIPMNAFNESMRRIFSALKQIPALSQKRERIEVQPGFIVEGTALFKLLSRTDNFQHMRYIEEIIGHSFSDHYFIVPNQDKGSIIPIKELEELKDPFFEKREHEQLKLFLAKFFVEMVLMYKKHVTKESPLLFIVEDCQVIDCLSIEFINQINDVLEQGKLKNLFMVCTFQTVICGLKDSEKAKNSKLNLCFEEIFIPEATIMMSQMMEAADVIELLSLSISSVLRRRSSQDNRNNAEPFTKHTEVLIENIEDDALQILLPLSFKGNPLFLIEITQSLLNQQLLIMKKSTIALSDELKKMPFKDYTSLSIPFIIEKVIGNIIDALKCTEIIILKHASAIGNIFDIDKLFDILSFPSITFEDLVEMIKNFESLGLIEILYDLNPKHIVAMFSIPFLREVLYQRMLVDQNYEIHGLLARKMQFSKFSYLPKETEQKILRHHLECAERTIFTYLQDDVEGKSQEIVLSNQKALVTRDIFEKLKIIDLKMKSSYYSVTKGIAPLLLSATLWKKDDRGNKYEERYCIITNQKFCYYYQNSDYTLNKEPLGSFFLRNIYQITLLGNEEKTSYHCMEIKVSAWFKKDIPNDDRTFLFAFDTKEELGRWEISLNFLRIKTMYDEFTSSFGMIQLPLKDNSRYEKKRIKRKLNIKLRDGKHTLSSIAQSKTKLAFNRKKTITNIGNTGTADHSTIEDENNNLTTLNDNVNSIFGNGLALFLAIVQERVFTSNLPLKNCPMHLKSKISNNDLSE